MWNADASVELIGSEINKGGGGRDKRDIDIDRCNFLFPSSDERCFVAFVVHGDVLLSLIPLLPLLSLDLKPLLSLK